MSQTNSTYTFTTCRIMHPSDQLTSVTPSLLCSASLCQVSPSLRSTPSSTPCTPRRLSLAESSTNQRDSTRTTSTSLGLVRLLLEQGISSSVYNPLSWDRGSEASIPTGLPAPPPPHNNPPPPRPPDTLPSTPPNSPAHRSPPVSAFHFSAPTPPYDNFLASKPASSILREVRGEAEAWADSESQAEVSVRNLRLVDKLKRFRTMSPLGAPVAGACGHPVLGVHQASRPPFGPPQVASSMGGLPGLNVGMRRNRSYPAMVGASMAMKDPGLPPESDILMPTTLPHTHRQTSLNDGSFHLPRQTGLNDDLLHPPKQTTLNDDRFHLPPTQTDLNEDLFHLPPMKTGLKEDLFHLPRQTTD
ncbi:trafficking kinesin-binding protein 1-like [Aplochiton taeniatus]